jgi:hypothetical protein
VRIPHPPLVANKRRHYAKRIEAMHAEERLGRNLTQREREAFALSFHTPSYRAEIWNGGGSAISLGCLVFENLMGTWAVI